MSKDVDDLLAGMTKPAARTLPDVCEHAIHALAESVVLDAIKNTPGYRLMVSRVVERIREERAWLAEAADTMTRAVVNP